MSASSSCNSPSTKRLEGKAALVTGGATGIGESIVRLFRRHGAKVCIVDVQDEAGRQLCESLGGGPDTCYFHCDVTVEDDIIRAVDFAVAAFGALDVMVNNAGMTGNSVKILDADLGELDKVLALNVKGVFAGMKHAARAMVPRRRGSIVSLASVSAVTAGLGPHGYTASKHAVVGLTKSVAAELGQHGIRVNCVSPYAVPTRLSMPYLPAGEAGDDALKGFYAFVGRNANLQGVNLTAEDVADAVVYLASDEARYVSGHNLVVDGGFTSVNHCLQVFR